MGRERLAFFDFCETIVSVQSVDGYVDLVKARHGRRVARRLDDAVGLLTKARVFSVLDRLAPNNTLHKRLRLFQLKGVRRDVLERLAKSYYHDTLKKLFIPASIALLRARQREGYRIIIASGGYGLYLKYFAEEFGIDLADVLATELKFDPDGVCLGTVDGIDCMRGHKPVRIREHLQLAAHETLQESCAYSDSISDLPLLTMVGHGVVVSKRPQAWAQRHHLCEVVWH
jgi:HAD superfamily hydrolase (TIGR01490 family)